MMQDENNPQEDGDMTPAPEAPMPEAPAEGDNDGGSPETPAV